MPNTEREKKKRVVGGGGGGGLSEKALKCPTQREKKKRRRKKKGELRSALRDWNQCEERAGWMKAYPHLHPHPLKHSEQKGAPQRAKKNTTTERRRLA